MRFRPCDTVGAGWPRVVVDLRRRQARARRRSRGAIFLIVALRGGAGSGAGAGTDGSCGQLNQRRGVGRLFRSAAAAPPRAPAAAARRAAASRPRRPEGTAARAADARARPVQRVRRGGRRTARRAARAAAAASCRATAPRPRACRARARRARGRRARPRRARPPRGAAAARRRAAVSRRSRRRRRPSAPAGAGDGAENASGSARAREPASRPRAPAARGGARGGASDGGASGGAALERVLYAVARDGGQARVFGGATTPRADQRTGRARAVRRAAASRGSGPGRGAAAARASRARVRACVRGEGGGSRSSALPGHAPPAARCPTPRACPPRACARARVLALEREAALHPRDVERRALVLGVAREQLGRAHVGDAHEVEERRSRRSRRTRRAVGPHLAPHGPAAASSSTWSTRSPCARGVRGHMAAAAASRCGARAGSAAASRPRRRISRPSSRRLVAVFDDAYSSASAAHSALLTHGAAGFRPRSACAPRSRRPHCLSARPRPVGPMRSAPWREPISCDSSKQCAALRPSGEQLGGPDESLRSYVAQRLARSSSIACLVGKMRFALLAACAIASGSAFLTRHGMALRVGPARASSFIGADPSGGAVRVGPVQRRLSTGLSFRERTRSKRRSRACRPTNRMRIGARSK